MIIQMAGMGDKINLALDTLKSESVHKHICVSTDSAYDPLTMGLYCGSCKLKDMNRGKKPLMPHGTGRLLQILLEHAGDQLRSRHICRMAGTVTQLLGTVCNGCDGVLALSRHQHETGYMHGRAQLHGACEPTREDLIAARADRQTA